MYSKPSAISVKTATSAYKNENKESQDEEIFDLSNYTSLERKQFTWSGMYPLDTTNKWKILIHNIKFLILLMFSSILAVSMTVNLILGVDNLSEVTAILYYLITQSAYLIKLANFLIQRHKLPHLEEHLKHYISYKFYKIFGHEGLDSIIKVCVFTGMYFRVCVTVVLVFYILVPLVSSGVLLPFAGWMPVSKEDYRAIIFTVQICCYFVSAYTNSSIDIYSAYYISIGVGELRLVKSALMNIDYTMGDDGVCKAFHNESNPDLKKQYGEDDGFQEKNEPKLPASTLREVLVLHKHAITLINMIENTFSYGIFVQFLASIAVICLTGFQMLVVSPASAEFVLLFFYFACMMCQVILYCWYGNEIMFESGGIVEACYMSNWQEADPKYKKVLIIMMERSKRVIFLTAGKFFILSLTTLVMIVKSSYSYFAVLQRLYKET